MTKHLHKSRNYSIHCNYVLNRNTNQINHHLLDPFYCLPYFLTSNHLFKRFVQKISFLELLIQCKPIIE